MAQNRVYNMAIEALENECFDMQDEFKNEQIAETVQHIDLLLHSCGSKSRQVVCVQLGGCYVKVCNARQNSWVSVSSQGSTGVSHSLAYITHNTRIIAQDEVKTLIDMINEAWYCMNND